MQTLEKIKITIRKFKNQLKRNVPNEKTSTGIQDEFYQYFHFHLSPFKFENAMLTSTKWLLLITFGPLAMLIVISLFWGLYNVISLEWPWHSVIEYTFADLKNDKFSTITLSIFLFAVIYKCYWYKSIPKAFQSLVENDLLRKNGERITNSDLLPFLEGYRKNLHSMKRYYLLFIAIIPLVISLIHTIPLEMWDVRHLSPQSLWRLLHNIPLWIVAEIIWPYAGILWVWTIHATKKAVIDLTPQFELNVQPLHSDKTGGFKKIGDLLSNAGLIVIVVAIPSIILAVHYTIPSIKYIRCTSEIQEFVLISSSMTQDRLADCFAYIVDAGITYDDMNNRFTGLINSGKSLKESTIDLCSRFTNSLQTSKIVEKFSIPYTMDLLLLLILYFALNTIFRPLLDLRESMVEYQRRQEQETNNRLSFQYNQYTIFIEEEKWEEVAKTKDKIKILSDELDSIRKYPRWPISSLLLLRSYLTSGLIAALATYLFTLLRITITDQLKNVISEISSVLSSVLLGK